MTQLGEGVWVTVPKTDQNKEQHHAAMQVCYPNGKPYYTPTPLLISAKINGGPQDCAPNLDRISQLSWLEPGSQVSFTIEEHVEDEKPLPARRLKVPSIISSNSNAKNKSGRMTSWRKKLRHAQFETNWRFMEGVGEGALSLVEFVGDAAEFAGKAAWLNAQVSL